MSLIRREDQPRAVLHFPELVRRLDGVLEFRCLPCRWSSGAFKSLAEAFAMLDCAIAHSRMLCALNRLN